MYISTGNIYESVCFEGLHPADPMKKATKHGLAAGGKLPTVSSSIADYPLFNFFPSGAF